MMRRSSLVVVGLVSIATIVIFAACSDEDDPIAVSVDGGTEGDALGSADGTADSRADGSVDARADGGADAPWDGVPVACSWVSSAAATAVSAAYDPAGNIFFTGSFSGTVEFGGGPLTSAGGFDVMLVKLDGTCKHVWSKRFGDVFDQAGVDLGFDDSGNVYLAGGYRGSIDFGAGGLADAGSTGSNIFVAKLTNDGGLVWSKSFGADGNQQLAAMAVAADGNLALAGSFDGNLDFGGGTLPSRASGTGRDAFVARLSSAGSHLWSKGFGPPASAGGDRLLGTSCCCPATRSWSPAARRTSWISETAHSTSARTAFGSHGSRATARWRGRGSSKRLQVQR